MREILETLVQNQPLTREQAIQAFETLMSGDMPPAQMGAMLALMQARGPSVDEIVGAATVMRAKVTKVPTPDGLTLIDTCGVGGTGSTFFNISTTAALVVAGAGLRRGIAVAKHGNRSITSRSGSAQVLEVLGVKLQSSPQTLHRCLAEAGICFCFAPAHHPAMKHAMPVRKELGIRTIFNFLGPLTNPAGVKRQLIGVPEPHLTDVFARVLRELGAERALIVHSRLPDGRPLGELTNFGPAEAHELRGGMIHQTTIDPAELDLPFAVPTAITVDGPEESAQMVRKVLQGERGPARDITRLNAAGALLVAGAVEDLADGIALATEAIDRGDARTALETLVAITASEA